MSDRLRAGGTYPELVKAQNESHHVTESGGWLPSYRTTKSCFRRR
jgi:hypothetical protein